MSNEAPDLADNLTAQFVADTQEVKTPTDGDLNGPGDVPFVSALKLNLGQEKAMLDHCFKRKEELERELGRDITKSTDWYRNNYEGDIDQKNKSFRSFFGKRDLFELTYLNDVGWRPYFLGGIFEQSNLVAPVSRRITSQMVARANNYFFGTDPWLAAYPVGGQDQELAEKADNFAKYKLKQCGTKHVLEEAVKMAFIRGESVLKTSYEDRSNFYYTNSTVMIGKDNQPIIAKDGDYIFDSDTFVLGQNPDYDPTNPEMDPATPIQAMILKRDMQTVQPAQGTFAFVNQLIRRKVTQYKGPRIDLVYFKDFLISVSATTVQDADLVAHLYDMPVADLVDTYMRKTVTGTADDSQPAVERLVAVIRDLAGNTSTPKSAAKMPNVSLEDNYRVGRENEGFGPVAEIAEFHFRFDADGDGIQEEIMLIADVSSRRPLFYDYEANVTPDGLRPFDVVRTNTVDGRWYGMGAIEMFETYQTAVDLILNRWNLAQTEAGRVTVWDPSKCYEGDSNPHLALNFGGTYTLKPGFKIEDLIQVMYLNDIKTESLKAEMDFFLQMCINESGVQNANDAQMSGLDQSKLATGIRNIEKSGQEMFSLYLSQLEPGFESSLKKYLKLLFARLDKVEAFEYFEGQDAVMAQITPEEVGDLEMNVSLEMSSYRGEQQLASNQQAALAVQQFYMQPPIVQQRTASFYIQMLKSLQVQNAEDTIIPMTSEEWAAMQPQAGGGIPANRPQPQVATGGAGQGPGSRTTSSPPNL